MVLHFAKQPLFKVGGRAFWAHRHFLRESHGIFVRQGNVAEWSRVLAVYNRVINGVGSNPTTALKLFCTLTIRAIETGRSR